MRRRKRQELGEYIVVDPEICGGEPTFKGTRMYVKDVIQMLGRGYEWDRIIYEFDGQINHEAIAEAIAVGARYES